MEVSIEERIQNESLKAAINGLHLKKVILSVAQYDQLESDLHGKLAYRPEHCAGCNCVSKKKSIRMAGHSGYIDIISTTECDVEFIVSR